ncbi:tubulin epsilon and delta complex protein 1-like [Branchiostoma lanceolatum]|uniref:tubulin epsilon and delta complex protein 1-like n=1 Tax=Branchiostoma lanceolatum TaxID=7740 RepID=UPI003452D745
MSQIKDCIQSLAQFLTATLDEQVHVSAETFRQAKFDRPEVTRPLWFLLYRLLQYPGTGEETMSTDRQLTQDVVVTSVKTCLYLRGYQSPEFLALPTSMDHGSRELLLAFGWLTAATDVIKTLSQPPTHLLTENTDYVPKVVKGQSTPTEETAHKKYDLSSLTEPDRVAVWLLGKLRLALRSLHAASLERTVLTHKIHRYTSGQSLVPGRTHLSPRDVYLLRHVNHVDKHLSELEKEVRRQEALLRWTTNQEIFWQWMESVLDSKLSSGHHPQVSDDVSERSSLHDLTQTLDALSLDILSHMKDVEDHLRTTNQTWKAKRGQNPTHTSLEVSADQRLTTEASLMYSMEYRGRNKPPVPTQLILAQKDSKERRTKKPAVPEENTEEAEECTRRWSELVDRYKWELERLRDSHKEELTKLTRSLDEVICIPPMVVKF